MSDSGGLRELWDAEKVLFDVFEDDPAEIVDFIKGCTADELHAFTRVHGVAQEIDIFLAVLSHPKCDRATALCIFDTCNPFSYEQMHTGGTDLDGLRDDEEDGVFLAVIDMAHQRLCANNFASARFHCPPLVEWERFPKSSPAHFKVWPVPAAALGPTAGERERHVRFDYSHSTIELTFEEWQRRRGLQ